MFYSTCVGRIVLAAQALKLAQAQWRFRVTDRERPLGWRKPRDTSSESLSHTLEILETFFLPVINLGGRRVCSRVAAVASVGAQKFRGDIKK